LISFRFLWDVPQYSFQISRAFSTNTSLNH